MPPFNIQEKIISTLLSSESGTLSLCPPQQQKVLYISILSAHSENLYFLFLIHFLFLYISPICSFLAIHILIFFQGTHYYFLIDMALIVDTVFHKYIILTCFFFIRQVFRIQISYFIKYYSLILARDAWILCFRSECFLLITLLFCSRYVTQTITTRLTLYSL